MNWGEFFIRHGWKFFFVLLLLAGSAFFSGTETALFNLTAGQLHRMRASRRRLRRFAASLMARPRSVLNTILLGNMLMNVALTGICAVIVLDLQRSGARGYAVAIASVVPLMALILFGEVLPKMIAYVLAEPWAIAAAPPMAVFRKALLPVLVVLGRGLVWPVTKLLVPRRTHPADITSDELEALLELSAKRGLIDPHASGLLREIINLTDLRVRDIMVPRVDAVAYDVAAPPEGLAELFRRTRLRKIPVYEGDLDHIVGVVHAKRFFLNPGAPLSELVRDVPFVPEAANLERVLLHFRTTRRQMAMVVDEYGGTAGLVTLEDVLEEIVGDIRDSHDAGRGPAVQHAGEREYLLDGDVSIHEWDEALHMDLAAQRISTIGGLVAMLLGRIPRAGDTVTYRNLRFTVRSMRRRRVGMLRLELLEDGG